MKAEDLRSKSADQLKEELVDLKKQQFNLRFQLSQGQLENTAKMRKVRRDIARIKTLLNEEQDTGKPAKTVKKEKTATKKAPAKKKEAAAKKGETKKSAAKKTTAKKKASDSKAAKKDKK